MKIKVSVIIPIYNVSPFIRKCAGSLFKQTMCEAEFIFVDDATPDNSITLLRECLNQHPECKERVHILSHDRNMGLPASRNTGLNVAQGEYIFHCDSDDFVEPEMLEVLYRTAKRTDSDIVWCDWYLSFKTNERYMKQPNYVTSTDALKGMLNGTMKFNVWNKLVRRTLYTDNRIIFPTGYGMGEDMTMIMLFFYAQKVTYVPLAFYHYVKLNGGAFSQTYSDHHLEELKYNTQRIIDFLEYRFGDILKKEIAFFKLNVKFPFLITDDKHKYQLWKSWYPEANPYIGQNHSLSLRSKWLQQLAKKNHFWVVRLYYLIVHRIVYGVIYR